MKRIEKRLTAVALAIIMVINLMPVVVARANDEPKPVVYYVDRYGVTKDTGNNNYISIEGSNSDDAPTWSNGWYVISGDSPITYSNRIKISGTVNLILLDDCDFMAPKGICVSAGNILNIYAGTDSDSYKYWGIQGTGKLTAETAGDTRNAAIGGSSINDQTPANCGTITINGGHIEASNQAHSAIGGGSNGSAGTITINGGVVYATSSAGSGIGSESPYENIAENGIITINGGVVYAEGGENGFGIGSSGETNYFQININGGVVDAKTSGSQNRGINYDLTNPSENLTVANNVEIYGRDDDALPAFPSDNDKVYNRDNNSFTNKKYLKAIKYSTVRLNYGANHPDVATRIKSYLEGTDSHLGVSEFTSGGGIMTFKIAAAKYSGEYSPITNADMIKSFYNATLPPDAYDPETHSNLLIDESLSGVARDSLANYQHSGKATIKDVAEAEKPTDNKLLSDQDFYLLWATNPISSVSLTVNQPIIGSTIGRSTAPSINSGDNGYIIDSYPMSRWSMDDTTATANTPYKATITLLPKLGYYFQSNHIPQPIINNKGSLDDYPINPPIIPYLLVYFLYSEMMGFDIDFDINNRCIYNNVFFVPIKDIYAIPGSAPRPYYPSYDTPATMSPYYSLSTPVPTSTATPTVSPTATPIGKKPTTITTKKVEKKYNGNALYVNNSAYTVTGSTGARTITYYDKNKKPIDAPPIDAGIYYYKVSVAEDEDYAAAESKYTKLTIKKADLKFNFIVESKTKKLQISKIKKRVARDMYIYYAKVNKNISIDLDLDGFSVSKESGNKYITIKKHDGVIKHSINNVISIKIELTVNTKIKPGNYYIKVKITVPPKDKENYNSHKEIKTLKLRIRE